MVAVSCSIAGEVPIAILEYPISISIPELKKKISKELGSHFVPTQIVTLEDLGLKEYPTTGSGKIKKHELRELVKRLQDQATDSENVRINGVAINGKHNTMGNGAAQNQVSALRSSIQKSLLEAYRSATGTPLEQLDLQANIATFADSIMTMRVRNLLQRNSGYHLSIKNMSPTSTIASQVDILEQIASKNKYDKLSVESVETITGPPGPPTIQQLEMACGGLQNAEDVMKVTKDTLKPMGFTWDEDVSAIFPVNDFYHVLMDGQVIQTCSLTTTILTDERDLKVSCIHIHHTILCS